jgi:hypothetical protein
MNAFLDDFNPKFVFFSPATGDLVQHVDEAIRACGERNTDGGAVVLEQLGTPAPGTMRIDLWVERADAAGRTYGFLCSSPNGDAAYARGERTVA